VRTCRYLILVILLILVSTAGSTIHPVRASMLMSHAPISIVGNNGFTQTSGVKTGNGSASNPYIIAGWSISATAFSDGVHIEHTNASFIIRNVYIRGEQASNGIFLSNVAQGLVDNTTTTHFLDGINILLSNATVENSSISSNAQYGIEIIDGENVNMINNTVTLNMRDGIHGESCVRCHFNITGNTVASNLFSGIVLQSLSNTLISENRISLNKYDGVGVYGSTSVVLVLNNIGYNGVGANLGTSANNLVHHNNFLSNHVQALDNKTGQNMWDVGYASGGNYWSNYNGTDQCSGPAQDVCPRPDGIGDTPYTFANARDNYPLMKLFVQTIIHDVAVSNITPSATSVNQTKTLSITVTVTNEGAATENFTLTLYYDTAMIGSRTILALAPGSSQALLFNWNTTGIALGAHTLKAVATTVWGEIDVADNTLVTGPVYVNAAPSTTPGSPTPTQPNPSTDSYIEAGVAILLVTFLVMMAYRKRDKTR
jgi:parallel beta-helix repeat protein